MKEKVYDNILNKLFENDRELKKRIESVGEVIAFNLTEIWRAIKQYQNELWLRFIKNVIILFLYNFKFLILSFVNFNMKTFCEHKLIKKIKKSQNNYWSQSLNKWKLYLSFNFLIFGRKIPSVHHKMVFHCVIIELIILIPLIINFLTIFRNNKKVSVLWTYFLAHLVHHINLIIKSE